MKGCLVATHPEGLDPAHPATAPNTLRPTSTLKSLISGDMRHIEKSNKTAYFHEGSIVILNPRNHDGGTAFRPRGGVIILKGTKFN